ncbi:conserved hypothetical protein (plasmid) [Rhodococcus jostii RHA1]|uniref:Uncharacterized protein n=3 Tax=Rhodococcus TaxID=1827 RepID=Q0RWC7_RHOJR|nr:conserved hypothetical protein [Rhodococcus jostii RHA1]
MVAMCAISVVCVIAMRETYQQDLSDNDEAAGQERLSPTST